MRLEGKIAVVIGAGQSPGEGIGNGRATVLRFAQEGARILAVDRDLASAEETAAVAVKEGSECLAFQADVTREATPAAAMAAAVERWGRIDILHNNVGVSVGGGDKPIEELTEEAFDRVSAINLRGTIMACKHALPIMRRQRSGAIVNISSVAAFENTYPLVTYKVTKAGMVAFTQQLALQNAAYGIRANCILPGLMDIRWRSIPGHAPATAAAPRSPPSATPRCRCAARWAPAGMLRTRHCSSPPTKPISSPASRCRS